ncbi:NAD(P)-binding oxidoreductase [uncultured Draconibacterium sp.]|uniref:NAD(P)-dependent oxidoreductase n=1 Tax=uncultured Draconibacterium sp. TaxID=1573823 RepID=UPI0029C77386|nr:NAD(P)-binding oxidoreductase [uncultured Draconibacterium sp.]
MNILIVGASGATGRLLVKDLLDRGEKVTAVVRSTEKLSAVLHDKNLKVVEAPVLELSDNTMAELVRDCDAVVSCLGHNVTLKGMYGKPRRLVTDAVRRLCAAIAVNKPQRPVKFILMNTSGNQNRDLNEPLVSAEKIAISLLRALVPPVTDNIQAAEYLRTQIGQHHPFIEWTAVRPDGLIDEDSVSPYEIHPSPIRSAVLNPGKVSRINVARFMAELICDNDTWKRWKGQMPLIYSRETANN